MLSYILYYSVWCISLLPLKVLYWFSDFFYYISYYIIRYRRRVVRTNLLNAFPQKSEAEIICIEKKFYRHLCDLFVEMYRMWHMSEEEMKRRCVFKHSEVIQHYFKEGRSVIGVLGHYGNWEWMISYRMLMEANQEFYALYKPLHDKVLDKMMLRIRSRFGSKLIPKDDILRQIVQDKRNGQLFLAGFIGDQTPNIYNLNFWMDFLNQDTPVLIGTEKIARKFNLPVISLNMRCVKRGYYEVSFVDLCSEPGKLELGDLTRMHTRMLEQSILECPELWLWSHKRWKHERKNTTGSEETVHNS